MVGLQPSHSAKPPQTPAMMRLVRERRRGFEVATGGLLSGVGVV
jgi:hypothetical protein